MTDAETRSRLASYPDWESTITKLVAYAHARAWRYRWIRGDVNLPGGNRPEDIALLAIKKVWSGEHRWDRDKHPRLLDHLKNRVDSLMSNLVKSAVHRRSSPGMEIEEMEARGASHDPWEKAEREQAREQFLRVALECTAGDAALEQLLEALLDGKKPGEIATAMGVDVGQIYNLQRKLFRRIRAREHEFTSA